MAGYMQFGGLVWTVENAAKRQCGRKTFYLFLRNRKLRFSKTHLCGPRPKLESLNFLQVHRNWNSYSPRSTSHWAGTWFKVLSCVHVTELIQRCFLWKVGNNLISSILSEKVKYWNKYNLEWTSATRACFNDFITQEKPFVKVGCLFEDKATHIRFHLFNCICRSNFLKTDFLL